MAEVQAHLAEAASLFDAEASAAPERQCTKIEGFGDPDAPYCQSHATPFLQHHGKDGSSWWSHKTADGWCRYKAKPKV